MNKCCILNVFIDLFVYLFVYLCICNRRLSDASGNMTFQEVACGDAVKKSLLSSDDGRFCADSHKDKFFMAICFIAEATMSQPVSVCMSV